MTDQPMRERLARALHKALDATDYTGPFGEGTDVCLDGYFNLFDLVDSLLTEMENPSEGVIEAGRAQMPAEVDYWQEGGTLRAEMRPRERCVSPVGPFTAMIWAIREGK